MSFLYPSFLFALGAVAIPVIIHLFNFRTYKTVYFSNVSFLKNIKQETKSKSEIKHFLILLVRILAIAALVIAFAQPYIPVTEQEIKVEKNLVGIYIDNSFSMDAESKYGNLLEVAKNKAHAIVDAYNTDTKFFCVTNDFEQKHQRLVNKQQVIEFINEIKVSPRTRNLSEIVSRQQDFLVDNEVADTANIMPKQAVYLLSDFQQSISDFQNMKNDTNMLVRIIPLTTQPTNNLYIDSCWFETPTRKLNEVEQLFARVINKSADAYNDIPVKLTINDTVKAINSININEFSSKIIKLSYNNTQTGILCGKIEITDYPITYDNVFYFSYEIAEQIDALTISEHDENIFINALFRNDNYIFLSNTDINHVKTSDFGKYRVIILNELKSIPSGIIQELMNFTETGGTLIFFPNIDGDIETYNKLLNLLQTNYITDLDSQKIKIDRIDYQSELYNSAFKSTNENIDLPVVFSHFVYSNQTQTNDKPLLTAENNHRVLSMAKFGKGKVYLSAIPLSARYSSFVKHPVFIPTLYNMVLYSQPSADIYYTIGNNTVIEINPGNTSETYPVYHIVNKSNTIDFIPQHSSNIIGGSQKLFIRNNVKNADNYFVTLTNRPVCGISFNYNRFESDLSYYSETEINKKIAQYKFINFSIIEKADSFLTSSIKEISQGKQYWKLFIIMALVFLGIETAILRLWK